MTITRHDITASMTLPAFWSPVSSVPVFADGFQSGVSSWAPQTDTTRTQGFNGATGSYEMRSVWAWTTGAHYGDVVRSFASVIGKTYRIVTTVRGDAPVTARVTLTPGTVLGGLSFVPVDQYARQVTGLLTASATTTFIHLQHTDADDAATVYWQDVAVYEMVSGTVLDLHPESATITLEESWSPFVRASITCAIPDADALSKIDPRSTGAPDYRQPQRVRLNLTQTDTDSKTLAYLTTTYPSGTLATLSTLFAGQTLAAWTARWGDQYNPTTDLALTQSRPMDLMLRTRRVDYVAGTMTLDLTSDEMLLQDLARYDAGSAQMPPVTASLRGLVQWGLTQIGANLSPTSTSEATINSDTVVWELGESMWSFLDSFIRTNGLRLYCDELRQWFLEPPVTGASGTLPLSSITSMTDVLSREDPAYGNGAVIIYKWTDALGAQQTDYRAAIYPGTPAPKITSQTFDTPNPSPLALPEVALRDRSLTRGRDVRIEALSDYRADPGQSVLVSSPVTTVTGAMVSAVTWRFPDDRMDVSTRDSS